MSAYLPPDAWVPAHAPLTSCPSCRSQDLYARVCGQFDVERSERYRPKNGVTFCDVYVEDCAEAMGVRLPAWWYGKERNANGLYDWLVKQGATYGWEQLPSVHFATAAVLAARFTVAAWKNTSGGPGHIAVLLPVPTDDDEQPWIAQAGARCFYGGRLADGFGKLKPAFFSNR